MAPKKPVKNPKHHIVETDFWGNPVHCTADNWTSHIIEPLDGHPELAGREKEVAKAIQDPDLIRPSTKTGKALAYDRVTSADTIRVIVYYNDPPAIKTGRTFGWIGTAYTDDPAYASQVGAPIYQKPAATSAVTKTTVTPPKKEDKA